MKKRHITAVALLLLFCCAATSLKAQLYAGIHGGYTLPQGYYADSRMSDNEWMFAEGHQQKAGAGKGWGAGIDISYAMPFFPNVEVTFSGDYLQSGVSRDVKEYYEFSYANRYSECSQYLMKLPKFRNVTLLLGVRYCHPLGGIFDLYGEALAGANIRMISDWTLVYTKGDWLPDENYDFPEYNNIDIRNYNNATTFAFSLGAGFLVKKTVTVGANFMMLGKSPLTWDRHSATRYNIYGQVVEYPDDRHVDYTDMNPTMVMVKIAYRLQPFKTKHVQDW